MLDFVFKTHLDTFVIDAALGSLQDRSKKSNAAIQAIGIKRELDELVITEEGVVFIIETKAVGGDTGVDCDDCIIGRAYREGDCNVLCDSNMRCYLIKEMLDQALPGLVSYEVHFVYSLNSRDS